MSNKRYTHFLRIDFHRKLRGDYNRFKKDCETTEFFDGAGNNSVFFGFYDEVKRDFAARQFYTTINQSQNLKASRQQKGVLFVEKK